MFKRNYIEYQYSRPYRLIGWFVMGTTKFASPNNCHTGAVSAAAAAVTTGSGKMGSLSLPRFQNIDTHLRDENNDVLCVHRRPSRSGCGTHPLQTDW